MKKGSLWWWLAGAFLAATAVSLVVVAASYAIDRWRSFDAGVEDENKRQEDVLFAKPNEVIIKVTKSSADSFVFEVGGMPLRDQGVSTEELTTAVSKCPGFMEFLSDPRPGSATYLIERNDAGCEKSVAILQSPDGALDVSR